jgi:hypothetical protein
VKVTAERKEFVAELDRAAIESAAKKAEKAEQAKQAAARKAAAAEEASKEAIPWEDTIEVQARPFLASQAVQDQDGNVMSALKYFQKLRRAEARGQSKQERRVRAYLSTFDDLRPSTRFLLRVVPQLRSDAL